MKSSACCGIEMLSEAFQTTLYVWVALCSCSLSTLRWGWLFQYHFKGDAHTRNAQYHKDCTLFPKAKVNTTKNSTSDTNYWTTLSCPQLIHEKDMQLYLDGPFGIIFLAITGKNIDGNEMLPDWERLAMMKNCTRKKTSRQCILNWNDIYECSQQLNNHLLTYYQHMKEGQ